MIKSGCTELRRSERWSPGSAGRVGHSTSGRLGAPCPPPRPPIGSSALEVHRQGHGVRAPDPAVAGTPAPDNEPAAVSHAEHTRGRLGLAVARPGVPRPRPAFRARGSVSSDGDAAESWPPGPRAQRALLGNSSTVLEKGRNSAAEMAMVAASGVPPFRYHNLSSSELLLW